MKWITWKEQSELGNLIKYWIDKGACTSYIVSNIQIETNKYTKEDIEKEIQILKSKWLIVGDNYFRVTAWSHDGVIEAFKNENWTECLKKLKKLHVYHPDMVRENIIKKEEAPKCQ